MGSLAPPDHFDTLVLDALFAGPDTLNTQFWGPLPSCRLNMPLYCPDYNYELDMVSRRKNNDELDIVLSFSLSKV
jgi:hypothetical protein